MTTLAQARTAAAAALSALDGIAVRARPFKAAPKTGDGWIVVERLAPADFTSCFATLQAVVVLSADETKAEQMLEESGTALIGALTGSDLDPTDVTLDPQAVTVGQTPSFLYAAVLTFTLEVT